MDSIGSLVDKLTVVNIKIFHLVDVIEQEQDDEKVAAAARKAQKLNRQRSQLMNEIDQRLAGDGEIVKV